MVRIHPDPPRIVGGVEEKVKVLGGLAQLGEHLLCKQGVVGSIPSSSTITCLIDNQAVASGERFQSVRH